MDHLDLARRTDALRALAQGLLQDPHDAEDVVQDAWVAALETETRPRDLVAWLKGTTQRLVARAVRTATRRRRRERAAARPEAIPGEAATEADILRTLAAELARLEEPYRTVLVLRYYRDQKPPEIAAALSVPLATVKTRLRRGLAILRARLAREHRSWALVLAPLALKPARIGLVLAAVGAFGAAAFLLLGSWSRSPPDARRAEETGVPMRRAEQVDAAGRPGATEDMRRLRADVLVEGPEGPLADADVKIAPLDRWTETTVARTDAQGVARFDVPAEGAYEVHAEAKDLVGGGMFVRFPGTARVRLHGGCGLRLKLRPWPDPAWAAFCWSAEGTTRARDLAFDSAEIDTGVWPAGVVSISCYPVGGGESRSVRIALPESGKVVHELHPPAGDASLIEVVDAETGALVQDWAASVVDPAWGAEVRTLPREEGTSSGLHRLPAKGCLLRIDADGYARAFVGLPREDTGPVHVALRRGAQLRFSFPSDARPREVRVHYNSPAGGTWSRGIAGGPGASLRPGEELNLTDRSWEPAYLVRCVTEADGWTAAGLPPEARLDIVGLDEAGLFAFRQVETGLPGSETSVEVRWPTTVRHRFVVRDKDARPVPGAEIRILDTHLGRDIPLGRVRTDAEGHAGARGFRTEIPYAIQLVHHGGAERQNLVLSGPDGETVLTAVEQETVPRRVLVLDEAGRPVSGARVQFGSREGFGSFALTGEDGVAAGALQPGDDLYLVAVCMEPGGGADLETMFKPPADDPIVYRGDLGKVRVRLEIEGEGLVRAQLRGGRLVHEEDLKVHVHGRGVAWFQLRVEPGEYRVEATLEGHTIERAFVARSGEPALVSLRFDR